MSTKQLILGATGIYFAYLSSSIIYEKMYSFDYPSMSKKNHSDKFQHPGLCVWVGALMCAIFGFIKGSIAKEPSNPIPKKQQIILGLLYTVNISAANYALIYVSYLVQTIGRNCRYLLVVIVGAYFSRVKKGADLKLSPKKIYVAVIITIGVLMFNIMKDGSAKSSTSFDPAKQWIGYILLCISVLADAFFGDSQAYSKANFKPTANHLFTSANFLTFLFVLLLAVVQGNLKDQIVFCVDHPRVIVDILSAGALQVLGQVSIYYVIANFKQHIFPLISTTRKILTVVLSIIIFNHGLNIWQIASIILVFGGLAYELYEEIGNKKQKQKEKQKQKQKQKKD